MNKICTSLEQSKKLVELGIDIDTADMYYWCGSDLRIGGPRARDKELDVPAWSLSALLDVIRRTIGYTLYGVNNVYMFCDLGDKPWEIETEVYDNEVDACVEMVELLHKENLI